MTGDREALARAFLDQAGFGAATMTPLAGDASTRSYRRIAGGPRPAVLMDAPGAVEAPGCPPEAGPEERRRLGYNAVTRLAGSNLVAFAGLSLELRRRGFSAPEVIALDRTHGFALLEDLGDDLYVGVVRRGVPAEDLYDAAIDVLAAIRRSTLPDAVEADGARWPLLAYDDLALRAEADLFRAWYVPYRQGAGVADEAGEALADALNVVVEAASLTEGPSLVLRDFHAENLLWLPQREGEARVGLIDFQDAVFGHPAYDLVSLLEDARRDVEPAIVRRAYDRFVERAYVRDRAAFAAAYAALGAQRNMKILGIFARLAVRDGKPKYLAHIPRVAAHLRRDLEHPALAGVAAWIRAHAPAVFDDAQKAAA